MKNWELFSATRSEILQDPTCPSQKQLIAFENFNMHILIGPCAIRPCLGRMQLTGNSSWGQSILGCLRVVIAWLDSSAEFQLIRKAHQTTLSGCSTCLLIWCLPLAVIHRPAPCSSGEHKNSIGRSIVQQCCPASRTCSPRVTTARTPEASAN